MRIASGPTHRQSWIEAQVAILFGIDILLLGLSFLLAFRLRLANWDILHYKNGMVPALLISVCVYLVVLVLSGVYRKSPRHMHLLDYLRVSGFLLLAWAISVTLVFLVHPSYVPPRSVTGVQWMLSLISILGTRAVWRYYHDRKTDSPVALAAPVPDFGIEDILDRPPVEIDQNSLRNYLSSRTVLVTGAGGSVGSVLSELLISLRPFRLVLVDVSEYNLFQLENTLRRFPYTSDLEFRIADVREEEIMRPLFSRFRPDIVFHAAAYKHVPLMEHHPIEAFRNNTMATVSLIRLCETYDTEQFVFISTDKAVAPTSVLGATKRLAEWYVRAALEPTRRKIIRFGNVFGSQGSVVPLFKEQIAAGGPVTVTHPEMERYFISAEEACRLVLQTLLLNTPASTYMLRMEPAIRIQDLAERMIQVLNPYPGRAIEIRHTGVRPGEKMTEHLMAATEQTLPTQHPAIIGLESPASFSRNELDDYLVFLQRLSTEHQAEETRRALFQVDLSLTQLDDKS